MRNYGIRQMKPAARILLICPDCGHENAEFADPLRGMRAYACNGEDCDYIFELAGPRQQGGTGFAEAWKRLYSAVYAICGHGAR
jgi:rubredoxin